MKKAGSVVLITTFALMISNVFAGGGGLEEYLCYSPKHNVSVTLISKLGSDLYKKGLQLPVVVGGQHSIYEIGSYSDDGNLIQFTLKPSVGSLDLGILKFSDYLKPHDKTIIQYSSGGSLVKASDVTCRYLGP
jgi:hypothetical protein